MSARIVEIVTEFEKETKDYTEINEQIAEKAFDSLKHFVDSDEFKLPINSNTITLIFCEDETRKGAKIVKGLFNVMVGVFEGVTRRHFYSLMIMQDPLGRNLEFYIGAERMKLLNRAALDRFMDLCKVAYGSSARREVLVKYFIRANLEHIKAFKMLFDLLETSVGFME